MLLTPIPLPVQETKHALVSSNYKPANTSAPLQASSPSSTFWTICKQTMKVLEGFRTFLPPLPFSPHSPTWTPHPFALITPLFVTHVTAFLLPFSTSTPSLSLLALIISLSPYRLSLMPYLTPIAYGSNYKPDRNYTGVYRYHSYVSFALFLKQTLVALLDNDPGAHDHRHSQYLAMLHLPHGQERSGLLRYGTALSSVLGAINDHPITSGIGWDVILAALSLCCWAAVRGLDISKILAAAGLVSRASLSSTSSADVSAISASLTASVSTETPLIAPGTMRHRKRKSKFDRSSDQVAPETAADDKAANSDGTFYSSDPPSSIVRGEEEESENLEAGAVSGALLALGGLGVLASAVLGADDV